MKMSEKRALVDKKQKAAANRRKSSRTARIAKKKLADEIDLHMETLQIFPDARIYKTNLTNKYKERKTWHRPNPQEVKSIIPGVVTSLEVKEGDHVEAGAHLLTYEAMKMQNIVSAPFAGTVEKIFVKAGEKTPKGVAMLYLKWDEEIIYEADDPIISGDLGLIV